MPLPTLTQTLALHTEHRLTPYEDPSEVWSELCAACGSRVMRCECEDDDMANAAIQRLEAFLDCIWSLVGNDRNLVTAVATHMSDFCTYVDGLIKSKP